MSIKNIITEIENDVVDVIQTNFAYVDNGVVPSISDGELTYGRGVEKKGKKLQTCVLYVDIRNSVALTEKHHTQTMGRVYTAFTKAVLKIARHHNGHTRNIIGDRVMVVFPSKNCFTNAVDCAVSINHIAKNIINKQFTAVDFKCGIGIDYGELRVIKVGIQRNGTELDENKGLVWVGYPANIASRLTDWANKQDNETYYEVVRNPINPRAVKPIINSILAYHPLYKNRSTYDDPSVPYYLTSTETVKMTTEEFANSISSIKDGDLYMSGGNFISFSKKTRKLDYSPILMTSEVYNGFKRDNRDRKDIKENYWREQNHKINNVSSKIFGGDVHWVL